MGETKKKDKPTKRRRQLCGLGKSSSDSEIAKGKGLKKERWPFPQSLTVDELARYRRRKIQGRPKDSLCRTEGSLGNIITEYRRAFRASSEDVSKRDRLPAVRSEKRLKGLDDGSLETKFLLDEEQRPTWGIETRAIKDRTKIRGTAGNFHIADPNDSVMESTTESSRFIPHLNAPGRPPLIRRGTSIKREGKFSGDTEQLSRYVAHEGNHRAELARRPTSLKMEGDMTTTSENCEKFIEWLNVSRPELVRLPTHLKLEGDLETSTENHEKYVPFVGARRPELLRQNANLKMEGESRYLPEYSEVFKDHNVRGRNIKADQQLLPPISMHILIVGRRMPRKPETHLRTEGNFYNTTETSEQFVDPRILDVNSVSGVQKLDSEGEEESAENLEGNVDNDFVERLGMDNDDLKGPPLEIPEYRDAFKDFPRERPKLMKPGDEIGRSDGSKIPSSPARSKFNTKIDMDPEYKSKFLDFAKESPVYRKPPLALRPSGPAGNLSYCNSLDRLSSRNLNGFNPSRSGQRSAVSGAGNVSRFYEATSEVKSQYVPYGNIPRVESIKMPANLQLEGNIDLQPEYRNAYCTKRSYHVPSGGEPRMHRRRERSSSESRRRDNYWTDNNNRENFGRINAGEDQDAFQILNTRVHEDSVVGKPPSGTRRTSLVQRSTSHADVSAVEDPSLLRKRSPSPTYRLHVCNVDDEPRGFGRGNQKQSNESRGSAGRPSDFNNLNNNDTDNYVRRSYSPSFGRASGMDPTSKSFVVLDNENRQKKGSAVGREPAGIRYGPTVDYSHRRNRIPPSGNNNKNFNNIPGNTNDRDIRPRNRTPPNWMRPWYDSAGE
ncbi:uncharacterized protein LOC105684273 isoform X2 [Athalia rosae]|uniref:uncharacterized protein LOC105684273 isoform X2 n=1 Tax=Athalia rosae TaxID=37344 RepID=UPI002033F645|nr:uncharacterized protein LOC105684273 isoform X2 [Athalia rosae]